MNIYIWLIILVTDIVISVNGQLNKVILPTGRKPDNIHGLSKNKVGKSVNRAENKNNIKKSSNRLEKQRADENNDRVIYGDYYGQLVKDTQLPEDTLQQSQAELKPTVKGKAKKPVSKSYVRWNIRQIGGIHITYLVGVNMAYPTYYRMKMADGLEVNLGRPPIDLRSKRSDR